MLCVSLRTLVLTQSKKDTEVKKFLGVARA
jgi:hypothetical protein